MKMVPRENVVPEFHFVKEDTNTFSATSSGWDYESPQLKNWFVLLGKDKDLGLFNDIAPHAISKKHMFSALWQFIEIFGMPIRIGKTNTDDNKQRQQMTDMMKNMGRAAWAVIDEEDKIEFAEKITGGADVFLDSIKVSNSEIAKGMVGVSGIFEDKSFAGTADVQSEILDEIISSFCQQAEFDVNDDLLPRMQKQGSMVDRFFLWKSKDTMTSIQKGEMIALLSPWFNFKPEEVEKEIGIAIDSVAVSPEVKQDISARIKALHSTFDIKLPSKNKEDE
jgi:hypothetical protein